MDDRVDRAPIGWRPETRQRSERESGTSRSPIGPEAGHTASASPRSSADLLPSVTLPKGGGAVHGMGEKFSVSAATGTGSLTMPLPLSPGRITPQLQLAYNSGSGNGPFGFGWSLDTPAITRKTDKGLPRYCDNDESDVFIISGAEDLVPILDSTGTRKYVPLTIHGTPYQIFFYRPRIEGLFARIERWLALDTGISYWRSISRENVTTLYGLDAASRIADFDDRRKIFSWRISRSWDTKGDLAVYDYIAEDSVGIDVSAAHEANRTNIGRAAQSYLTTIRYGNRQPYSADWSAGGSETPLPTDWMFSVVLDYGDHAGSTPKRDSLWPARPDPFSTYRAGFELRTYRRVQRLLFFNNFPLESGVGADCLVRSLDLVYSDQQTPADPHNPLYTLLVSAKQIGYRQSGGSAISRSLPPLEFEYSQPQIQPEILSLDHDSLTNLPEGLDGARLRWVDLDGEGLSGGLSDAGGGWYYKRNLSANNQVKQSDGSLAVRARFGSLETVGVLPSHSDFSVGQQFLDLSGSGRLDVVELMDPDAGFFKRTKDASFEPFQQFTSLPKIDWTDPNVKFIDVTGNGLADILITEDGLFTFHTSLGEAGFDLARLVRTPWDEEKGPKLVFADGSDTIFVADMSGDGLNDIVRVRNGESCYWPNIGYGRFGAKVTMDHAPRFASEERFDPRRIRLADIDGTGTADLLYIGEDGVRAWFNESGNAWSAANEIAVFPTIDRLSTVQALDLLGNGTACLVWSSPLPGESRGPLLYVDLMGGQKPHLMVWARNNLGAETRLTYAPSTRFYLNDKEAGRPWVTRLPFPVQLLERVETIDWIGRNRLVTRYAYHHGYFDGYEREFRGFGMVEQWDTEEFRADTAFPDGDFGNWDQQSWSPPMLTRTWFHTGAFTNASAVSKQYAHEYWVEPALRAPDRAADAAAMLVPDTMLPANLDAYEIEEAYRALKGQTLRVETYADDGTPQAANPYTVTEQNFTIQCLQHKGADRHAVFLVCPREAITFHYERSAGDPRVTHEMTLETDPYGNVERSASIGYPRRPGYAPPEPNLPASMQAMLAYDQVRLHALATENQYTNAIDDPDAYRVPLPSATNAAELTGITPSVKGTGITNLFTFGEIDAIWQTAWTGANDVPYEAIPSADVDGKGAAPAKLTRRFIAQSRTRYRSDDLSTCLALGQLQPRALHCETYGAALTPGLLAAIFDMLVSPATLKEGGYVQLDGEAGWWMPSGRLFYSPGDSDTPLQELAGPNGALAHFFRPRRAVDPFGAVARVDYDVYDLLPIAFTDPVNNVTTASNDYRVLMPVLVTDPNGNRGAVAFDALGLVVGTAVMAKATETLGDSLSGFLPDLDDATIAAQFANPLADPGAILTDATTRIVYDLGAYFRTRDAAQPAAPTIYVLARETHVSDGPNTRYQYHFVYCDGFAREIQHKAIAASGRLTEGGPPVSPRWLGSRWTIFNNKGNPVRKFEPFFSATNGFEFDAKNGVSSLLLYDPAARVVATLHPNNSWEKVVFDPWRQDSWDGNDTVLASDPRSDPDVRDYFQRALGNAAFTSWHDLRIGGTYGTTADDRAAEKDAAQKAEAHADTPNTAHFDALGRHCLSVADNGGGNRYASRTAYDTQGKPLAIFDALGRRVEEYCFRAPQAGGGFQYLAGLDMAGNPLYRISADGGARRSLNNVAGKPIRNWDARGHAFRVVYDPAQRATHGYVSTNGASEILIDRSVYGEGLVAKNLCGRLFRHYDMAGCLENGQYDYTGNLLSGARQLTKDYHQAIDWTPLANLTGAAALDTAAAPLLSAADRFDGSTVFDALNRPIQIVTPYSAAMKPNVLRPAYDEGALLNRLDIWLQQAAAPTGLLVPATADQRPVTGIDYNARGQRLAIAFGNGTNTAYDYDAETFRLAHLTTTRPDSFPADQQVVQALAYYYDPVGNITRIRDNADTQNVIYFNNQRVEPSNDSAYDPLYRLTVAAGREHLGQTGKVLWAPQQVTNNDSFRTSLLQPGDGYAMGMYTESYCYDQVGNILTMAHATSSGAWSRPYAYEEPSQITPSETCNRLSATGLLGDPAGGPFSATYAYDAHGNMTRMPHLPALTWDEDDRLRSTTRQVVSSGTPETTFYVSDAGGQRVRKTTDRSTADGQAPMPKSERIYLGGIEIYREFAVDGITITLERETLHIDAAAQPVALVETRTTGSDDGLAQMVRYQHSNHLGSAVLELDDQAQIISYEEYFPYGSTSYQAVRSQTDTPKRYRYTGKERDSQNDLYFHGARYYAPWLGRWISCDPAGTADGHNLYRYTHNSPIQYTDSTGRQTDTNAPFTRQKIASMTTYMAENRGKSLSQIASDQDEKRIQARVDWVLHNIQENWQQVTEAPFNPLSALFQSPPAAQTPLLPSDKELGKLGYSGAEISALQKFVRDVGASQKEAFREGIVRGMITSLLLSLGGALEGMEGAATRSGLQAGEVETSNAGRSTAVGSTRVGIAAEPGTPMALDVQSGGIGWKRNVTVPAGVKLYAVGPGEGSPIGVNLKTTMKWGAFQEETLARYVEAGQINPKWYGPPGTRLWEFETVFEKQGTADVSKIAPQKGVAPSLSPGKLQYYNSQGWPGKQTRILGVITD